MLGLRSLGMLFGTPHLLALVAALLATLLWRAARGEGFWTRGQLMTVFSLAATFLHLQFASVGWFYRYEAYLVALGVVVLLVNRFDELVRQVWQMPKLQAAAAGLAMLLAVFPVAERGAEAIWGFPTAAHNLFEQQYQMALFFQKYYPGASVALNDVGLVNYLADIRCLDLYGLCDRQVLALKRHKVYDTVAMANRAEAARVQVAVVYEKRFGADYGPPIPASWTRVGAWQISDNAFLGGDTVTFYAVKPTEVERLAGYLREFAPKLPAEVTQTTVL